MHDDQVEITTSQVAALVAEQIPALAGRNVVRVESAGTVNAIFRISADVAARFPLRSADPTRRRARLRSEAAAATEFHLACPFPAPEPIHVGEPGHGYPLPGPHRPGCPVPQRRPPPTQRRSPSPMTWPSSSSTFETAAHATAPSPAPGEAVYSQITTSGSMSASAEAAVSSTPPR